jgi:hypothetical protein
MKKAHPLQGRIRCGVPVDGPEQSGHHCTSSSTSLALADPAPCHRTRHRPCRLPTHPGPARAPGQPPASDCDEYYGGHRTTFEAVTLNICRPPIRCSATRRASAAPHWTQAACTGYAGRMPFPSAGAAGNFTVDRTGGAVVADGRHPRRVAGGAVRRLLVLTHPQLLAPSHRRRINAAGNAPHGSCRHL